MSSNREPFGAKKLAASGLAVVALSFSALACSGGNIPKKSDGTTPPTTPGVNTMPGGPSTTPTTMMPGTGTDPTKPVVGTMPGNVDPMTMPPMMMGVAGSGGTVVTLPPAPAGAKCDGASTPGAAPAIFVSECASCHGMTASGRPGYPSLRRASMTLAEMTAMVRGGKINTTLMSKTAQGKMIPTTMPAFSTTRISDADIAAVFAYRNGPADASLPVPAVYCLARPEATWTQDQITAAYTTGLAAWRKAGDVDGNACTSCHAADPMDLAFIGYSDAQIYRRSFAHQSPASQATIDAVIDMVHAMRAKYNITQPPNPLTYRPFQPGGEVLPGATSALRDQAFGQELKDMNLRLMGAPINTVADAKQAWTELAALNLRTLKVGVALNHYTEDIFNNDGANVACADKHTCEDHGTIADWMTDTAVIPGALPAATLAAQDAYLANPTLDTLKAAMLLLPRDETSWFKHKYGSVMIANFFFKQQAAGDTYLSKFMAANPTPFPVDMKTGMLYNTIWMVGANQRDFIHNVGATLGVGGGKFSVPSETIPGLTRNDANEQLQRIIVPWFWLGFTLDPSTMNVEPDYVAEGDEYFTQETFLDNGSLPIHGAFIVSKRSVEMMKYDVLPRSPNVFPFFHPDMGRFPVTPMTMRAGYFPVVTNFAEEKNFNTINSYQLKYTPTAPEHKALYQTYAANQWRMFMWTLVGELQTTPQVWNPNILQGKIKKAEIFLTQPEMAAQNGAMDTAMIAMARDLVGKATVGK